MTFSIVARDRNAGQIGVATQSHYFALGNIVPWLQPGVGAVATQSFVEPSYGPLALDLLGRGQTAQQALDRLVAADAGAASRQVAVLPVSGPPSAHTGSGCVVSAGQELGEDFAVIGNMLADDQVWPAMAEAFRGTTGTLAHRLVTALEAGQEAGGDVRGMQAAALKVVRLQPSDRPWTDTLVDLRVDDHVTPIVELRRLLDLAGAYHGIASVLFAPDLLIGDTPPGAEAVARAEQTLTAAMDVLGDNQEARLWRAVLRAKSGDRQGAATDAAAIFAARPALRQFVDGLVTVGVIDRTTHAVLSGTTTTEEPS